MVFFVHFKKLPAVAVAFQYDFLIVFLDNRQMINILLASSGIFTDKVDHFKPFVRIVVGQLALSHHHSRKAISRAAVKLPLHHYKCRLACRKVALKRPVLGIAVTLVYERSEHHLHENRLSPAVLQRHQRTPALHLENIIADAYGVVVVI